MELKPVVPTTKGPGQIFTGDVYIDLIHWGEEPSRIAANLVRFTPGARTHWHSHGLGQTLYVVDGVGLVATRDGTIVRIRPGDTVYSPSAEEHWHGATDSHFMSHLSLIERPAGSDGATWLEPVTDDDYRAANQP